MKKIERNTNLELLRIISMFFIIMSHADDYTGLATTYRNTVCLNKFIADWLQLGGQIGVGCFLLISGYFMVDQNFKIKKIFCILGEVWFYTIGIYIIFLIVNLSNQTISISDIIKQGIFAIFPISFSHYWFMTAYIILMILSPFLNKWISTMDKHMYQLFLGTISIFVVLEGTIPKILNGMIGNGRLIPVFFLYFVAGYIKKYVNNEKRNAKKHIVIAFWTYMLLFATVIGMDLIGNIFNNDKIISFCYFWRRLNSPFVVIINIELFLGFLRIPQKTKKFINRFASNTLGVYLIHVNKIIYIYIYCLTCFQFIKKQILY